MMDAETLKKQADAYLTERLSGAEDPAIAERLLIGDREFVLLCMCSFAAKMVADQLTLQLEELTA
jgi:hypothetical protein